MKGGSVDKLQKLKSNLRKMKSVAIAYSGGADSTFLVNVAYKELGKNAIAVTATSSTYPQRELKQALDFTKKLGVKHIIINSEETDIEEFSKNPSNRCYYCKRELFTKIKQIANDEKINFILDGSNVDDKSDYRPGMKALKELGIVSPLMDVGLTKKDVKELSHDMNLETWNKPAFACLASRFPYGTKITKSRLNMIEKAEDLIRNFGLKQFRVRFHNEVARIEVLKEDFPKIFNNSEAISRKFKKLGFNYIALDIEGYRTGSMNEVLKNEKNITRL